MENSEKQPELALSETPMVYWLCVIFGTILATSGIFYGMQGGFVVASYFIPALPGALYATANDAGESVSSILLLATFALYMLTVIMITVDLVKRAFHKVEPMPMNSIIITARFWSITSLGFLILAAGLFLYAMFKDGGSKDEYIIIKKK